MRLLREPLVHFLAGGAFLFALYALFGDATSGRPDRVVVGPERVKSLASNFERTWMRPPTAAELEGLIHDYVIEEVLYREALALGLDRDDLVVRRRMRQKMEFLNEGLGRDEPDEATLAAFLVEHAERFRIPARRSFEQVFLDRDRADPARVQGLLETLQGEPGAAERGLGDATLLPRQMRDARHVDVAGRFGEEFADALFALEAGGWRGPLTSGFGMHLVRVTARSAERAATLEEVRPQLLREWEGDRRERERQAFYDALLARYEVEVRMPEPPAVGGQGAANDASLAAGPERGG